MFEALPPLSEKQRKNLILLVVIFCLGVTALGISYVLAPLSSASQPKRDLTAEESVQQAERRLSQLGQDILSKVDGVGRVAVQVTLATGPTTEYARNEFSTERETEERAESGITRKITEGNENAQLAIARSGSIGDRPVVTKIRQPEVSGVLVVAEGAEHPEVRDRLYEACKVLYGLTADRISVLPMKRSGR
ncbi:MAG TPA: hypothetical protein GXX40_04975 [Firmicutes bacterium]|nr:hypothetical protein [Bacillota bacterium]